MQRTDTGLIVPDHLVERTSRATAPGTLKRLRQFLPTMQAEGIAVVLGCRHCNTPLEMQAIDRLDERKAGGRVTARCKCSVREIR